MKVVTSGLILKVKCQDLPDGHDGGYKRNREESRILWVYGPTQLPDNLVE